MALFVEIEAEEVLHGKELDHIAPLLDRLSVNRPFRSVNSVHYIPY